MTTEIGGYIRIHPNTLSDPAQPTGRLITGVGVSGLVDICVPAFARGDDVAFRRVFAKPHGLRLLEEGPTGSVADVGGGQHLPQSTAECVQVIRKNIVVHEGSFKLSGGGTTARYIDTIPAVTSFASLYALSRLAAQLCTKPSALVAPPYGGVALGIFLGMAWGVDVLVPLDSTRTCSELDSELASGKFGDSILLADDYFSTGSTARRLLPLSYPGIRLFTVCKTRGQQVVGPLQLVSIFENKGGDINFSTEVESLLAQ